MKIICIADTHGFNSHMYYELKDSDADVIIHAGDSLNYGTKSDAILFNNDFSRLPMKYKIVVAGNHDAILETPNKFRFTDDIIYLQDSEVIIEGIKFFGSPWSKIFYNWAFMLPENKLAEKWAKIPLDTNILITHSPPFGTLDYVLNRHGGSETLANHIKQLKISHHIFGHIHESFGQVIKENIHYINCSMLGDRKFNAPIDFTI